MAFRRIHKFVTYLMAVQGLGLLAMSGKLTPAGSVLVVLAVATSWFVEGGILENRRWNTAWNGLTVVVFGVQMLRWISGEGLPEVAVQFAAWLQVMKLFNRRRQSDHDQIAILALLHLIASAILFTQLSYAVVFAMYTIVTPWMLVVGQIRREVEAKYWDQADGRSIKDLERVLNSKRIVSGSFLGATALLSLPIYLVTAVLFLVFPRVGFGILAGADPSQRQLTGFSDQVVIGDLAPMFDDPTVVLRAEFPQGRPADDLAASIYWRGSAYDSFDGNEWHRTLGHGSLLPSVGRWYVADSTDGIVKTLPSGVPLDASGMLRIDVFLQPLYPKVVFVPQQTRYLNVPAPEPLSVVSQKLRWGPSGEVRYSDPGGTGIHYEVSMDPPASWAGRLRPYGVADGRQSASAEMLAPYLQTPALSGELRSLAARFQRDDPDPLARALAIEAWLRTRFGYTTSASLEVPAGSTPLDAFLFDWRKGNCEYFSSAMVVMLRSGGIPARNVTGFIGGRWNEFGDYLAVREADAHSWVEAWIEGSGWIVFDPTPPSGEPAVPGNRLVELAGETIDAMRLSWHKHIIAYDLAQQAEIVRHGYRGMAAVKRWMRSAERWAAPSMPALPRRALVLVVIVAAFLAWHSSRKHIPRPARALAGSRTAEQRKALDLIALLDRRMDVLGLRRPSARPPLAHARQVWDDLRDPGLLVDIVCAYNASRFGGEPMTRESFADLRGRIGTLGRREVEASPVR